MRVLIRFISLVSASVLASAERFSNDGSRFLSPTSSITKEAAISPAAPLDRKPLAKLVTPTYTNTSHHIVYTADSKVFDSLFRSMLSVGVHLANPGSFAIHLIVPKADLQKASGLGACFQQRMRQGGRASPVVQIHEVEPMSLQVDYRDRTDLKGHSSAFARLFISDYLPNVSRAVYMDADTLVRGDLSPLFEMPMLHALAAVQEGTNFEETWGKWYPNLADLVPDPKQRSIFNDGVLVLDLQRWRAEQIQDDIKGWASNSPAVDDQLLLNLEFQIKKGFDSLPQEWNDFRVRPTGWPDFGWADDLTPDSELSHAKILHWTGPKPWNIDSMRQQWMEQYRSLWELPGVDAGEFCDFGDAAK